ncbi:MAG: DNA gyrase/topoisomerase IV subunit A [Bacteroidota bacterium]
MENNGHATDQSLTDDVISLSGLYENWFLDYASYVILDRAIPHLNDGLKPVQRRILHALYEMNDGRFHKVANVIGQTMQYHPHGDASIGDALVNLGQKDLLVDTQGNWGDIRTGDRAAAPRYIETRLSKFGLEVLFNPQTTEWQLSYDGRKREPVTLPVKFPMLLMLGVEGIAVGLATKIMPHNFIELIDASIKALKGKSFELYPDFPTGGTADFSDYNDGKRGGKVKVRAKIEEVDSKTLAIREIPYATTTDSLINSILKANDAGKIKVKKVVDNTAKDVEILVNLASGTSPDKTIAALYAFTDCEVSISPNACLIVEENPKFLGVKEILRLCTENTKQLLKRELEIRRKELQEKIFFLSLEKIFIENRIYRKIEEAETWEEVLQTIHAGLKPYLGDFYRQVTDDDVTRLTEIRIKRISKYDANRADDQMTKFRGELEEVEFNLEHLVGYAVNYFKGLKDTFGKGRERKTKIAASFDEIEAAVVAENNVKLYVNRKEGFVGTGLKKEEFICDCSDIDDIIVFRKDGVAKVSKIADKLFMGKDIIHVDVFRKGDERMVYNLAYLDAKTGRSMVKRFQILAVTRDREYSLISDAKGSKVLYFTANPNGEAEIVTVQLTPGSKARQKTFDYDFADLEIKGRGSKGNILSKYPVRKVTLKEKGESTLGGFQIWYDPQVGTLNTDEIGESIGTFMGTENILVIYKNGSYEMTDCELTNRYDFEKVAHITKLDPEMVVTAVYYDGESKTHYLKRFQIETSTLNKNFEFINQHRRSEILGVSTADDADLEIEYKEKPRAKDTKQMIYRASQLEDVKGWKAIGTKLSEPNIKKISLSDVRKIKAIPEPKEETQGGLF